MSDMVIALEITALGMGLVFAAIILLWGIMDLLTFLTADRELPSEETSFSSSASDPIFDTDLKAQAAAVAVAIALAEQQTCQVHLLSEPPTVIVSPWQLGMRTRQLYEKRTQIIRKPREIG